MVRKRWSIIRERTVAGLEAARARGRKGGRPMTDKKKLDKAIKLHESGEFTVAQIEEMTDVSKGSLYRELNRRKQGAKKADENNSQPLQAK